MYQPDEATIKMMLQNYKSPDITRKEVSNVLKTYKSLYYRPETFVFNNGTRKDLLNLDGTIPVNYKGAVYNIPVCVWLMDTHPNNAPLCYVKPTPDMAIKVSRYVDSNGRVYLPYLHDWNPKTSTLIGLIQKMIAAFGELCPVYTLPSPHPNQAPFSMNMRTPGMPPYPVGGMNMPYPSYPGYPQSSSSFPVPETNPMPIYSNYPQPPMPQLPPKLETTGTVTSEHIRASLLSAIEDKLRRRFEEQRMQSEAELETLKRTQTELEEGRKRLEDIIARLNRERDNLNQSVLSLIEKEKELEEVLKSLETSEGVDVDEAVTTTAPLYAQLLDAFAKEATAEDAAYYIGEALNKGQIDLDTFLKQVRALSRQQFTLRALMHKCRQKAGLSC